LKFKSLIFIVLALFAHKGFSQDVQVKAVLDTSKIRIGEQVKLDLYVSYDANQPGFKIEWPALSDSITEKIEVLSHTVIDTTIPEKNNPNFIHQHQQIIISAYDSGYFAIPGFKFTINGDTNNVRFTQPLMLEVHTVPTDTSAKKIKDIKTVLNEPFNWKWYLPHIYWGIGILLAVLTIVLITLYYARKKRNKIIEPEKPKIPAHITALASLEKIKTEKIWKEGLNKEYYSSISDTIRLYIEERYGVFALESTTDEIMTAFRSQVVDAESKDKLRQLLQLADLVKFAKMMPIEAENEFTLQNAFDFVNGTKREEEIIIEQPTAHDNSTSDV
jgi:hypothetical protein